MGRSGVFALVISVWAQWVFVGARPRLTHDDYYLDSCFVHPDKCALPLEKRAPLKCEPTDGVYSCAIKLGTGGWNADFCNTYLAKVFIEEVLGYPVEIRADFESMVGVETPKDILFPNGTVKTESFWKRLVNGDVDAVLEVWPSNHPEEMYRYISKLGSVINAGHLGVIGKVGWYIPSFMVEELNEYYSFWKSLRDPELLQLLASPREKLYCCPSDFVSTQLDIFPCMPSEGRGGVATIDGGFNNSEECDDNPNLSVFTTGGRFVGVQESWVNWDHEIIKSLGLNLTIELMGTETNLEARVVKSVEEKKPILFYFWSPHGLFGKYNITPVSLPPYNDRCFEGQSGEAGCDYPTEELFKVYAKRLQNTHPDVAYFLEIFKYSSTTDQEDMLFEVYNNNQTSLNEVAKSWIQKHAVVWGTWVALSTEWSNKSKEACTTTSMILFTLVSVDLFLCFLCILWLVPKRMHTEAKFIGLLSIALVLVTLSIVIPSPLLYSVGFGTLVLVFILRLVAEVPLKPGRCAYWVRAFSILGVLAGPVLSIVAKGVLSADLIFALVETNNAVLFLSVYIYCLKFDTNSRVWKSIQKVCFCAIQLQLIAACLTYTRQTSSIMLTLWMQDNCSFVNWTMDAPRAFATFFMGLTVHFGITVNVVFADWRRCVDVEKVETIQRNRSKLVLTQRVGTEQLFAVARTNSHVGSESQANSVGSENSEVYTQQALYSKRRRSSADIGMKLSEMQKPCTVVPLPSVLNDD
mmetsp:Transcript_42341/g.67882  ORF Transcript_42341/g.67882 Transcript_42341/m.67882 type:complete len:749 (-) Transcript_42341:8097-10343(-)